MMQQPMMQAAVDILSAGDVPAAITHDVSAADSSLSLVSGNLDTPSPRIASSVASQAIRTLSTRWTPCPGLRASSSAHSPAFAAA